jgi:hypothetical protein
MRTGGYWRHWRNFRSKERARDSRDSKHRKIGALVVLHSALRACFASFLFFVSETFGLDSDKTLCVLLINAFLRKS